MQIRITSVTVLVAVLSFTILSADLLNAQEQDRPQLSLAVLVVPSEPFNGAPQLVAQIEGVLLEQFNASERFQAISPGRVAGALSELELEIFNELTRRQIDELADVLNADFILIVTVDEAGPRHIELAAQAFNSRGQRVVAEETRRLQADQDELLGRAVQNLLAEILEELI